MGTVNVVLGEDTRLNLILGQQLENAVTSVVFDFSAWQTTYGSGTLALSVQRPGDEMPYAVTLTTSGTNATWSVTNLDTAYKGVGHIQLTYMVGSAIKKSVVYKFTVYESLGANGEYPSPGQTWQEEMEQEITDVKSDLDSLSGVPTEVRQAMLTLLESAAYAETGLQDEIAIVRSWAETVTSISLNQSTISISGATTSQLVATTVPAGKTVTWSSSDTSIATVSNTGLVTGVGNGTATITAICGDKSARCSATVSGFAELVSISAVYTQSGTVYDTDTLDILKSDLVVTAHYDNSTTQTITTYTLSGTLAEGTSTITVAYGGKTTTFNVTVTSSSVTNPYVSDNMTLWLDGIYNKSTGHDSSATSWENLITGDLFANTGITVGSDGMVFDGTAGHGFLGDKPSSPTTIEVVIDVTTPSTTQCIINGFGNTYNGNVTVKSNALLQRRGSTNGGSHALGTGLHTHTFVIGTAQYVDGNVITDGSTTISLSSEGKMTIGNAVGADGISLNTTSGAYPLTGTIKCIRFYSDVLTAEEVASNFAVDATRFGIS